MGSIANAYAWMNYSDERKLAHLEGAIENFYIALEEPTTYCCSGRCDDTNWGGMDRLHYRGSDCPEVSESELWGYIESTKKDLAALDK